MNELQKQYTSGLSVSEDDLSPHLSEQSKRVVRNSFSQRCKVILNDKKTAIRIYQLLTESLQKAVLIAGFRANAELSPAERDVVIKEMIRVIERHTWLSIDDLETIINQGLSGEFDTENNKSFALNARFLGSWINAYHDKFRSPAMSEQSYYIQRQEREEETRKSDLHFDKCKARNKELVVYYCEELRKAGSVSEFNFGSDIDHYLIAFYFTFKRYGLFVDCETEIKQIWQEEVGDRDLNDQKKLEVQKTCRIRLVKRFLARLINNGTNINQYFNQNLKL